MKKIMLPVFSVLLSMASAFAWAETTPAAAPDLAKASQTATQVCAACHGADGNSTIPTNPKLAGQHEAYILKQLHDFKPKDGKAQRNNPIMAGMVAPLSDSDMKGLAAYFSQQKYQPDVAKNKATLEIGQRLYRGGDAARGIPACAGCHGATGAGIPAQYPRLQGQFASYTEAQLKAFRAEERANDANKVMRMIAVKMTDPEIKAVADYMAGLR